eukprot:30932-Pelagococcus_subviridis.AAC.4
MILRFVRPAETTRLVCDHSTVARVSSRLVSSLLIILRARRRPPHAARRAPPRRRRPGTPPAAPRPGRRPGRLRPLAAHAVPRDLARVEREPLRGRRRVRGHRRAH